MRTVNERTAQNREQNAAGIDRFQPKGKIQASHEQQNQANRNEMQATHQKNRSEHTQPRAEQAPRQQERRQEQPRAEQAPRERQASRQNSAPIREGNAPRQQKHLARK